MGHPACASLVTIVLLLAAVATTPAAAARGRRGLFSSSDVQGEEPTAQNGASLAEDGTTNGALPSGQGPLYSTTAAITSSLERWAAASASSSSEKSRLSLLKLGDPLALAPGAANGSPSYGAELSAVRFTDASVPSEDKRRAVLTCSTHARELITGETCFALARLLAGAEDGVLSAAAAAAAAASSSSPASSSADPAAPLWAWREMRQAMHGAGLLTRAEAASARASQAAFKKRLAPRIAKELDLVILPVVNAAGRDLIEREGRYALRKTIDARDPANRPQVDPNRSYPWQWKKSGPGSEGSETYTGDNEAWPWEVRAVAALLGNDDGAAGINAKKQLDAAIDVHSGIHALLYPYGYKCDTSGLPEDKLDLWQRAATAAAGAWGDIIVGPTSSALYIAAGTTSEYAYGALGASLAATPEIYNADGDGKHQVCPKMEAWAAACAGSADLYGSCACASSRNGGEGAPAVGCVSSVAAESDSSSARSAGRQSSASSSSSPGFGGGELTPAEVLLEAAILRRAGDAGLADAAERDASARLGLDVPTARAAARAYWGERYTGGVDPGEESSAHYQPGKWPAGVTPGVDLADAIQMGEPVRNSGEQWYARDPYLRHWPRASRGERQTFGFFNPVTASEYRRTVADYAAGVLAMLLTGPSSSA